MKISAVILAGGEARRLGGRNKALLPIGGSTIFERQVEAAREIADELIVVTNNVLFHDDVLATAPHAVIVADAYPGCGPLAGVHAGFSVARGDWVWLLACDQPLISSAAARLLLAQAIETGVQAAVPVIGGRLQPLHAVYRPALAAVAGQLLADGMRRMMDLLERCDTRLVEEETFAVADIPLSFADDVDTPEQYDELTNRN